MNRRLTKAFIGALSFAAALSTAVVCNASDAQAKKASVKKVTASAPSGKNVYVAKGKKVKITTTVKVKPNKKANKKVTYKSANKKLLRYQPKVCIIMCICDGGIIAGWMWRRKRRRGTVCSRN